MPSCNTTLMSKLMHNCGNTVGRQYSQKGQSKITNLHSVINERSTVMIKKPLPWNEIKNSKNCNKRKQNAVYKNSNNNALLYLTPNFTKDTLTNGCRIASTSLVQAWYTGCSSITTGTEIHNQNVFCFDTSEISQHQILTIKVLSLLLFTHHSHVHYIHSICTLVLCK